MKNYNYDCPVLYNIFNLHLFFVNLISIEITINLNICSIIWLPNVVGWTTDNGQKALPTAACLDSGIWGTSCHTSETMSCKNMENVMDKVQIEREDWDPNAMRSELVAPGYTRDRSKVQGISRSAYSIIGNILSKSLHNFG